MPDFCCLITRCLPRPCLSRKKDAGAAAELDKYRQTDQEPLEQDGRATLGEETAAGADTVRVLDAITACQEAITSCQATLTARIEEVKVDISLVRSGLPEAEGKGHRHRNSAEHCGGLPPPPPEYFRQHAATSKTTATEAGQDGKQTQTE